MLSFVLAAFGLISVSGWVSTPSRVGLVKRIRSNNAHRHHRSQLFSSSDSLPTDFLNDESWEFLINGEAQPVSSTDGVTATNSRRSSSHRIAFPPDKNSQTTTILASSTYAAPTTSSEASQLADSLADTAEEALESAGTTEEDPYASAFDSDMQKMKTYAERVQKSSDNPTVGDRLKNMDFQDIVSTLIIPSIALFAAGRWAFNRVSKRVIDNTDTTIDSFAREMIYHDGDFDEMKLCYKDYSRKLVFLGPTRTDAMLKAYLESYAKKKTVSPKAIVSLGYVFTLAKLSDERAANLLVSLCRQMGPEKVSSAGKLLFLGSRILKSPEEQQALEPIKDLIKGTYRDATVAESLVDTSQQAIAEASYRACVQSAGKNQQKLTVGWETLGLDRDTAQRIFDEEAEDGFLSDREAMYGGQTTKYDKKGRRLDKEGKLEDPAEAKKAEEEKEQEESVSNVYECSECGYTLFVAQGRETKFFGTDFKCPECGAAKDKFEARDDFGED